MFRPKFLSWSGFLERERERSLLCLQEQTHIQNNNT
ncbi:unnamed protein product [Brassica oleracea var. botrytis]